MISLTKIRSKLGRLLSSEKFFAFIIILTAAQGLWFALSFQPHIFDEARHIGTVEKYESQYSPFITSPDPALGHLGEITRDPSYLFYWLMSWPARLISLFSDSYMFKVIALRIISGALFIAGLIIYRKVFLEAKLPKAIVHTGLLFMVLVPTTSLFPGSLHYDNAIFLLYALVLLLALRFIRQRQIDLVKLIYILVIGLIATVVKFTFVALFAPVAILLTVHIVKHHRRNLPDAFRRLVQKNPRWKLVLLSGLVLISLGLFIERPIKNMVVYGQIQPDCQKIMTTESCMAGTTAQRNLLLLNQKPANFRPFHPFGYTLVHWIPDMVSTQVLLLPGKPNVYILLMAIYTFFFASLALILVYLRDLAKTSSNRFLLWSMAGYVVLLSAYLYLEYRKYSFPVAINSRYLLQVMPIFLVFAAWSFYRLLRRHTGLLLLAFVGTCLLFTQGGSIISFGCISQKERVWTSQAGTVNDALRRGCRPLLFVNPGF